MISLVCSNFFFTSQHIKSTSWIWLGQGERDDSNDIQRSILNYAVPIWTPQLSTTNWNILQTTQNAALRVATGCHRMSPIEHLHNETKVLPVREHNIMIIKQYSLSTFSAEHPCNKFIEPEKPPRNLKKNIYRSYPLELQPLIPNNNFDARSETVSYTM